MHKAINITRQLNTRKIDAGANSTATISDHDVSTYRKPIAQRRREDNNDAIQDSSDATKIDLSSSLCESGDR